MFRSLTSSDFSAVSFRSSSDNWRIHLTPSDPGIGSDVDARQEFLKRKISSLCDTSNQGWRKLSYVRSPKKTESPGVR